MCVHGHTHATLGTREGQSPFSLSTMRAPRLGVSDRDHDRNGEERRKKIKRKDMACESGCPHTGPILASNDGCAAGK